MSEQPKFRQSNWIESIEFHLQWGWLNINWRNIRWGRIGWIRLWAWSFGMVDLKCNPYALWAWSFGMVDLKCNPYALWAMHKHRKTLWGWTFFVGHNRHYKPLRALWCNYWHRQYWDTTRHVVTLSDEEHPRHLDILISSCKQCGRILL